MVESDQSRAGFETGSLEVEAGRGFRERGGGPGGEAQWLARGPPKAGVASSKLLKQYF